MNANRACFKITGIYALVAAVWIVFSDRMVEYLGLSAHHAILLSTAKGFLFVGVTATLLFFLIQSQLRALDLSQQVLATIVENIPEGIFVIKPDWTVSHINHAVEELFELSGSDDEKKRLITRWLQSGVYFTEQNHPLALEEYPCARALQGLPVHNLLTVLRSPSGKRTHVGVSAVPIRTAEGQIENVVMTLTDRTEIMRLEKLRDEFLSNAAHELKTPLSVIKSNVQLLQRSGVRWDEARKKSVLNVVDGQCDKLTRLIEELIAASAAADGVELKLEKFDLAELLRVVGGELLAFCGENNIMFETPSSVEVVADRGKIERVCLNLLQNALKFSQAQARVRIKLDVKDEFAWVSVQDSGIGISPEESPHIFERYYRGAKPDPNRYGGMGIGLNLSRQIIVAHGGTMTFETQQDVGSTFRFSLPLKPVSGLGANT